MANCLTRRPQLGRDAVPLLAGLRAFAALLLNRSNIMATPSVARMCESVRSTQGTDAGKFYALNKPDGWNSWTYTINVTTRCQAAANGSA